MIDVLLDAKVDMMVIYLLFTISMCLTDCIYFSYPVKGAVVEKIFKLNKYIVHLIYDIFWNMGFKTETQTDKVVHIRPITCIVAIVAIIPIIPIILILRIICRFVRNLDFQITCGMTRGR